MSLSKGKQFEKIAKPNNKGFSDWVKASDLPKNLQLGNGWSWGREGSSLEKKYFLETKRGKYNSVKEIRLIGFNNKKNESRTIRSNIKQYYKTKKCVITYTSGAECDHKNGRYNDPRVNNIKTQRKSDFQSLHKDVNKAKRQRCKECKESGKRFDAKLLGYPISYYKGSTKHSDKPNGCVGCFWYDPIEFRKHLQAKDSL
jgi:hypothetical protein